jgi:hypothetical protein
MPARAKKKTSTDNYSSTVGDLYQFHVLDPVIQCARWISLDFNVRPKFYRTAPDSIAGDLADLQAKWGVDTNFPDTEDRNFLFASLFGGPLAPGATVEAQQSVRAGYEASGRSFISSYRSTSDRVRALIEYQLQTNVLGLENAVRSHLIRFRSHLLDIQGAALATVHRRVSSIFHLSATILREPAIAGVFGVTTPLGDTWPLEDHGPEGGRLVGEISRAYSPQTGSPVVPQDHFIQLQRIAQYGRAAIAATLEGELDSAQAQATAATAGDAEDRAIQAIAAVWYVWASELDEFRRTQGEA